ncbi:MAG: hypothetical protein JXA78_14385 [Anaerolineales bacterium]|nr:hypothetical protein [Anaerolineales bacterium]
MNESTPPESDLAQEFRNLGKNLAEALRAAWERPERKRLEEEIANGLNEMGNTLRREAEAFAESPTGQQLKTDVQQIGERIRSPEVHAKAQQELLSVLQTANAELQKVIQQWAAAQAHEPPGGEPGEAQGDQDSAQGD